MITGRNLEQTKQDISEAIQGHIETLRQFSHPLPEPSSTDGQALGAP